MTSTSDRTTEQAALPQPRRLFRGAGPNRAGDESARPRTVDFTEVFAAAMKGAPCRVLGMDGAERMLPMARWSSDATASDDGVIGLCEGTTLDVGCGPGRLTSRLAELGHVSLGVDIVQEAVRRTRERGVSAVHRDLFERLPGEGRWQTVLLADGNIGIGGDPVRLLGRMAELAAPGGRIVVEAAPPGGGLRLHQAQLRTEHLVSRPFSWAVLAVDHIGTLLHGLPLSLLEVHQVGREDDARWVAVLVRDASS